MAVHIDSGFTVGAPLERAWAILTDVPRIAPCMPGAELTEVVDANTYRGVVRVKIGPVALVFAGEAQLREVDPAAHAVHMAARASDTKGRGSVQSDIRFRLEAQGEATRVAIGTDLTLTGSVAQYGRGVGLIREIANQFTLEFARNLECNILAGGETPAAPAKPLSGIGLAVNASKAAVGRLLSGKADETPGES